jgi:hypothetical protein
MAKDPVSFLSCHKGISSREDYPWAFGPLEEMKIAVVVTSAKAGIHVRPEEAGFPRSRE